VLLNAGNKYVTADACFCLFVGFLVCFFFWLGLNPLLWQCVGET